MRNLVPLIQEQNASQWLLSARVAVGGDFAAVKTRDL
jgi:hypothetical protein